MDGLQIEFVPDPSVPAGPQAPRRRPTRRKRVAGLLIAGLVLLAVAVRVPLRADQAAPPMPTLSPTLSSSPAPAPAPPPQTTLSPSCSGCGAASPSAAMQAAFAAHIPGSIVIDEHSSATLSATSGEAIITARTLKAVYGNVEIRVTISLVAGREASRQTVRLTHGGYVLDFDFIGYYPPTASQLRALADDPRLVAPTA